jgi:hypothetical protein
MFARYAEQERLVRSKLGGHDHFRGNRDHREDDGQGDLYADGRHTVEEDGQAAADRVP